MKTLTVIISALSLCAVFANWVEDEDVLVLTKDDFDEAVLEFKHLLVEFCTYW